MKNPPLGPRVLAYHGIGVVDDATDTKQLVLRPGDFERHVKLLLHMRYRFTTVEAMAREHRTWPPPSRTAVLTFDDGWLDGLTTVLPILQRLGVPATFAVCPALFDAQHPDVNGPAGALLSASDVLRLSEAGCEIASHSMRHDNLCTLSDGELARDLVTSRLAIEELLDRPCRTLVYPFGLHDGRVEQAAEDAGYDVAVAFRPGPWRRFAVPRLPAPARKGTARLALKMLGAPRRPAWTKRRPGRR